MKVHVIYDLSKEEDEMKYRKHLKAVEMSMALYAVATELRKGDKYNVFNGGQLSTDAEQCLMHEVNKVFWQIMNDHEIDPFSE